MILNQRLDQAIRTSAVAHNDQKRKGTNIPYVIHPFSVMLIASEVTVDEDTLIACLFHDILEDASEYYSKEQMVEDFGQKVADIVASVTKNSKLNDWLERSEFYLKHIENEASNEAVIVCAADKVHNLMSILNDYEEIGDEIWERFSSDKHQQLWWYRSILGLLRNRMPESKLTVTLGEYVGKLEYIVNK